MTTAQNFLTEAARIMDERAKEYDQPEGERSMEKIVKIFNLYTDKDLSEPDGWLFMQILKDVRQWSSPKFHLDSAKDCIAYAALKAESCERLSRLCIPNEEILKKNPEKTVQSIEAEISDLLTVMVAAAEEIHSHWDAHCDEEGYGPRNLMHRLENGIAAKYPYTAGDFSRMQGKIEELNRQIDSQNWLITQLREEKRYASNN